MKLKELINTLAQYELSSEVVATHAGVLEVPKVYYAQGYIIIDLDCKFRKAILDGRVDIAEIMSERNE